MIRRRNSAAAALLLLAMIQPIQGFAGPYEDGDLAFRKKSYEAAFRHWLPAASPFNPGLACNQRDASTISSG